MLSQLKHFGKLGLLLLRERMKWDGTASLCSSRSFLPSAQGFRSLVDDILCFSVIPEIVFNMKLPFPFFSLAIPCHPDSHSTHYAQRSHYTNTAMPLPPVRSTPRSHQNSNASAPNTPRPGTQDRTPTPSHPSYSVSHMNTLSHRRPRHNLAGPGSDCHTSLDCY